MSFKRKTSDAAVKETQFFSCCIATTPSIKMRTLSLMITCCEVKYGSVVDDWPGSV